jgi:outer membrane receptor protein involved in Fe transport
VGLRAFLLVLAVGIICWSTFPNAFGQTETARLTGRVTDPSSAVIPGADLKILNLATGVSANATSNSEGIYSFPSLMPGKYRITVHKDGFREIVLDQLVLNVQDIVEQNFKLDVGSVSESVTVTADALNLNISDATVGSVVDRQFVGNIPLNGRTFQPLITLSPGVVLTNAGNLSEGQFSVNGQRADANYISVDGVSANIGTSAGAFLGQGGSGALPGVSAGGGFNSLVSVDALQEFRIQTSTYAPEFGRTPGGQVSIVTRSGTNAFHGSVFEYLRNNVLDASDWFTNFYGLNKPEERLNDFGGVIGGPIIKNKTFFFVSYEGLRVRQPQSMSVLVPSVDARNNAPDQMKPFLKAFPVPNGTVYPSSGLANFNASFSNASTLNAFSVRVDQAVNDKLTLFGRYNYAPSQTNSRGDQGLTLSSETAVPFKTQTATVGASWIVSPRIINDFRLNYSQSSASNQVGLDNFGGATVPPDSVLFPPGYSSKDGALIFLAGFTTELAKGTVVSNSQRQANIVDTLSMNKGSHQLKFGGDYRYLFPLNGGSPFSILALFVAMGNTSPFPGSVYSGIPAIVSLAAHDRVSIGVRNFSLFGQDTWKVNDRLNLTYGVRWEYNPPPTGRNVPLYALTQVQNMATVDFAPKGTPLYKTTYNAFAPRVGLAYKLFQTSKGWETVLRGGWGIFYDLGSSSVGEAIGYFPNGRQQYLFGVNFPLNPAVAVPPPFSLSPPYGVAVGIDPNLKIPYTQQWNIAIEQSLGSAQTFTLSYVGAIGRNLLREEEYYSGSPSSILNPSFSYLKVTKNTATSDYNALQAQFKRRLSRGLQAIISYTWAHSIDIASADTVSDSESFYSPRVDRGPSDFDFRHTFNAGVTYNIPAPPLVRPVKTILSNWSVYSNIMARSAEPFSIYLNVATPYGSFNMRPDLVPGVPIYISDSTAPGGMRLNAAAFDTSQASQGIQGSLGRNALRGFGAFQLDAALQRQFKLTERFNLQFRAEFFNLLNHPNFGNPYPDLGDPRFGVSQSTLAGQLSPGGAGGGLNSLFQIGGPRSIQLALKLNF